MMALTLLSITTMKSAQVRADYAERVGHRIPCEQGRVAYHLSPFVADRCCGRSAKLEQTVYRRFADLAPMLTRMPWAPLAGEGRR